MDSIREDTSLTCVSSSSTVSTLADLKASNRALQHSMSVPAMKQALGEALDSQSTEPNGANIHKRSLNQCLKDNVVKITPSTYQCKFFCGGLKCKYCSTDCWSDDDQAIKGLYSNWITDQLLATARPTSTAIEKYGIVKQFLDNGIMSIVNLQHANEHRYCGPKLDACGFSYNIELFMKHAIFHYNFGWPDFGVTALSKMLDMVKVLSFALHQGKVAVHCHAGLGRTGVLMGCYLIWSKEMHPKEAIQYVRKRRPNSIQNKDQVELVYKFAEFLRPIRLVFNAEVNLLEFVQQQQYALHGVEARVLKHLPKLCYVICERLNELFGHTAMGTVHRKLAMLSAGDELFYENLLNQGGQGPGADEDVNLADTQTTMSMIKKLSVELECKNKPRIRRTSRYSSGKSGSDDDADAEFTADASETAVLSDEEFATAMKQCLCRYLPSSVDAQVTTYSRTLKQFTLCWDELADETNPLLLLALLGRWFRCLREPLVQTETLMPDVTHFNQPMVAIKPAQKWTILYLCNNFATCCGNNDPQRLRDAATLLCDWLTWSRDEKSEAYFHSCLLAVHNRGY